jgi:hypothetical protein
MYNFVKYKIVYRSYWRLNAVIGFVLLNVFSIFEGMFTSHTYYDLFQENIVVIRSSWKKY